jgi:nucleotidyltransferase substrate binding protein (TIGR01987 family)
MTSAKFTTLELVKSAKSLEVALTLYDQANPDTPEQLAFRDACLQRFEYCLELAWKSSLRTLGSPTNAAKPAVREMARNKLIKDPSLWITFVDARNKTSHSYDEDIAKEVFASIKLFLPELKTLIQELEKI